MPFGRRATPVAMSQTGCVPRLDHIAVRAKQRLNSYEGAQDALKAMLALETYVQNCGLE
jgi:hypothetical protein